MKTLKELLLIALILLISSCNNDDTGNNNGSNKLSPPSWAVGVWKDKEGLFTVKITSNNVIVGNNDATAIDFSKVANSTPGISISELIKTDTDYKVGFSSVIYHFRKKSDTQIAFILADDPEYPAEWILYKVE